MNSFARKVNYKFYKKLIWLYILLLVFEGAFRKWFLPSLSDIFLVIRDPIVVYFVVLGLRNRWIKSSYAIAMMMISIITFFLTLLLGHQNIFLAIYGCRITMFYFPFMFVVGKILNYEDIVKIGKFFLQISFLMTIIIIIQYFSPQNSWINVGIGGTEGSGFSGVGEYFRPSGTFSFITGMMGFNAIVLPFIFYFLLTNRQNSPLNTPIWIIYFATFCYIISIFICLSRTIIFQTICILFFVYISTFLSKTNISKMITSTALISILILILFQFQFFQIAFSNMFLRFGFASDSEGSVVSGTIGERYLGSFIRAFTGVQNFKGGEIPFWGFGQGYGTNVAAVLISNKMGFLVSEEEWSRVVAESGYLFGWGILFIRLFWSLSLLKKSFRVLTYKKDLLAFLLMPSVLIFVISGQWSQPTILGFSALLGGLVLASLKPRGMNYKKCENNIVWFKGSSHISDTTHKI
ncbi:hypothetical protein [Flavobacterium limnophilum]|uniref:hypothetical protein n=1 Tax=Flavobacterium limnophilum TaxID=3003262 RepID=UPI0022AC14EA|nr:hypothetical protein [Flavobacterium limnophilum]